MIDGIEMGLMVAGVGAGVFFLFHGLAYFMSMMRK
jgi:hypothetical protein